MFTIFFSVVAINDHPVYNIRAGQVLTARSGTFGKYIIVLNYQEEIEVNTDKFSVVHP